MNKKILLIIAVLASAALSARAQNLVTNPGFETGDFTGWTQTGDNSFTDVQTFDVHSGTYAAEFGPLTQGGIFQNIATVTGQSYNISFWLDNRDTSGGSSMSAAFGGTTLLSLPLGSPTMPYTFYSFTNIMATSNSTALAFNFSNAPSWWDLDDVSVTAAVPEPGTLGLVALGVLGVVGALRKRLV